MASSLRSIIDRFRNHLAATGGRLVDAARAYRRFAIGVLALLALLAFMAAAPIRALDAANQRVENLRATKQQLTTSITDLERERARLQDRGHVELLARRRFGLVRPGETAYVVVTPEDELRKDGEPPEGAGHRAWYEWLFDAVVDMLPS
jgi:cell division protein FtsB